MATVFANARTKDDIANLVAILRGVTSGVVSVRYIKGGVAYVAHGKFLSARPSRHASIRFRLTDGRVALLRWVTGEDSLPRAESLLKRADVRLPRPRVELVLDEHGHATFPRVQVSDAVASITRPSSAR